MSFMEIRAISTGQFYAEPFHVIAASDSSQYHRNIAEYVCDGTNDEITIQSAIDNATEGETLYFCNGTYSLNPQTSGVFMGEAYTDWLVAVKLTKGLTLTGDSGALLKIQTGTTGVVGNGVVMFNVLGEDDTNAVENLHIHGLTFDGQKSGVVCTQDNLIFLRRANNVWIENNTFQNGSWHIYGDLSQTGENFHVNNNLFDCNYWNGMSLHNGGSHSEIRGNIFQSPLQALLIDTCEGVVVADNIFTDVTTGTNSPPNGIAIYILDRVLNSVFTNNIIKSPKSGKTPYAFYAYTTPETTPHIHDTSNYNLIQGNLITDWDNGLGIVLNGESNVIMGNVFNNVGGNIMDDQGTNTVIKGNVGLADSE